MEFRSHRNCSWAGNSSSASQKRSSTGKNGSTGSTAEKIAGAVRWCAAKPCHGLPQPVDPAGEMLRGGRRDGSLQLPLQRSGLHGVEAVVRAPLPGQDGETVRIAQQVIGRHGRAEGRRHPHAAMQPLGRAVRAGKAQRLCRSPR